MFVLKLEIMECMVGINVRNNDMEIIILHIFNNLILVLFFFSTMLKQEKRSQKAHS